MLAYTPTPIQKLQDPLFEKAGVRVLMKREDLNHPYVSGNKWWKLKYNLQEAERLGKKTLLTFGGAYSNHIYATAAAARELGFKSIGVIRGEETLPLNSTLQFARGCGMQLHHVSRQDYRGKSKADFIQKLYDSFGDFYLIPEGGTNALAVKGVEEFAKTLGTEFDYVCCAVGTGGTLAGLINGLPEEKKILGFPVLKGGGFLKAEVEKWARGQHANLELITDYHFGGYGKVLPELMTFIKRAEVQFQLSLDQVYTAKSFYGVYDLIIKDFFVSGSTVLFLHTGGLQGRNF